jgi:prephenate dehydrogenase
MKKIIIGIIGGTGSMGRWFERFFSEGGHKVLIAGRKTKLTYQDLAGRCQVVVLSVPKPAALKIAAEVGPLLDKDQLLMDFCSLKEEILTGMLKSTSAQVCGTHPLFGPLTTCLEKQNVIICEGRGTQWLNWLENELKSKGAVVTRMDPVVHDKQMAVVQGLNHLLTICLARTLQKMEMNPQDALNYTTPVFRIKLDIIGRLFGQDLSLYRNLIKQNPHVPQAVDTFLAAMEECRAHFASDSPHSDNRLMKEIHDFLNAFCSSALEESNALIKTIYAK